MISWLATYFDLIIGGSVPLWKFEPYTTITRQKSAYPVYRKRMKLEQLASWEERENREGHGMLSERDKDKLDA